MSFTVAIAQFVVLCGHWCINAVVSTESSIFLGSSEPKIDSKRRIQISHSWRLAAGATRFALVKWQVDTSMPPCVLGMLPPLLHELVTKMNARPFSDPQAENVRRSLSKDAAIQELDGMGRLTLPVNLMKVTGLETGSKVVVVGMFDRFQIWNHEVYHQGVSVKDDEAYPEAIKLF